MSKDKLPEPGTPEYQDEIDRHEQDIDRLRKQLDELKKEAEDFQVELEVEDFLENGPGRTDIKDR